MSIVEKNNQQLFTPNFILAFIGNFLMFFAFYLLLPVLPMYLIDKFQAGESIIGIILASYTLTALLIRPFAGFIVDYFARKPLLVVSYFLFVAFFTGYIFAATLLLFAIIRAIHGLTFGLVTISSSTMAVDIMPASKRNEGIGFYSVSTNIAMAFGPMTALFLYDSFNDYYYIFMSSVITGLIGLFCVLFIKAPYKQRKIDEAISLDRFFLLKGTRGAISFTLLSFGYGMLSTYVALYGKSEVGLESGTGLFFVLMAAGLISSRILSHKFMKRDKLNLMITTGMIVMVIGFVIFVTLKNIEFFYLSAVILGIAYGFVCPAFQAMFINMAHHNQRGTANSTYFISWDLGIGIGVLVGGQIASFSSFTVAYTIGIFLILISLVLFRLFAAPYYHKMKLI